MAAIFLIQGIHTLFSLWSLFLQHGGNADWIVLKLYDIS
jgi:hypothetical protein